MAQKLLLVALKCENNKHNEKKTHKHRANK